MRIRRLRILLLLMTCAAGAALLLYQRQQRAPAQIALPAITPAATPQPGSAAIHDIVAPFDWYVWEGYLRDGQPEPAAAANCGPTVLAMALRYASGNSIRLSPEAVRDQMPGRAGTQDGTIDQDLAGALDRWGVPWRFIDTMEQLATAIANDHIVLVPIAMNAVLPQDAQAAPVSIPSGESISGRFYLYDGGHWIVAKGLAQDSASGETYIVTYDPNVWEGNADYYYGGDQRYPKGLNRLYSFGQVELGYRAVAPNRLIEILATPATPAATASEQSATLVSQPAKDPSRPYWCYTRTNDTQDVDRCVEETP